MAVKRILIAGAGIGGLTAACCLLKRGFDVDVYEQASSLAEVGAGIQISANPMHALRDLGLGEAIEQAGVRPTAYVFRLHDTGEVIQTFALSAAHERQHGAPYVQLHRADLHDLLVAKARSYKSDVVHLRHKAVGFDERADGVALKFADGSSVDGDALVGADGVKSIVRAQIAGSVPPIYTGDAAWRLTIPADRLPREALDQSMSVFMGPGGHAVCYFIRGAMLNFVGCVEAEPTEKSWTARFPWEKLKADFAGWHPIVQAIVDAANRDECYRWSMYVRPVLRKWSTPRSTILGDAAHPTLPYLAQGAAMAIEDGAVLARALSETASIEEGLDLYQRNRIDRTARVVAEAAENRKLFHLRSVAEIRSRFAGRNEGAERNRWLYSYNPMTVDLA